MVEESTSVVVSEEPQGSPMMRMIYQAASNPNMAVETFERYVEIIRQVKADEAKEAYHAAMNACQSELTRVAADASNPQTKSRYASYPALDRAVRPIYTKHGFSLTFGTEDGAPPDHMRLVCHVSHSGGHTVDHRIDMPADGKGAKGGDVMTKTHAMGAAASYGQRYLLKLIFNIAVGEDEDGNDPIDPNDWIGEQQVNDLVALMDEVGADREKFLRFLRVDTLAHLHKRRFQEAVKALEAKRKAAPKKDAEDAIL